MVQNYQPESTASSIDRRSALLLIFLDERVFSLAVMALLLFCVEVTFIALRQGLTLLQLSRLIFINMFLAIWVALYAVVRLVSVCF